MAINRPKSEEIVVKLRQVEVLIGQGMPRIEQLSSQGVCLPFFCDDVFETFDEERTQAACRVMERVGKTGQAIYLTHHRHVVDIAKEVCSSGVVVHEL